MGQLGNRELVNRDNQAASDWHQTLEKIAVESVILKQMRNERMAMKNSILRLKRFLLDSQSKGNVPLDGSTSSIKVKLERFMYNSKHKRRVK